MLFQFVLLKLQQEKNENKQKTGRDWPILKKRKTNLEIIRILIIPKMDKQLIARRVGVAFRFIFIVLLAPKFLSFLSGKTGNLICVKFDTEIQLWNRSIFSNVNYIQKIIYL